MRDLLILFKIEIMKLRRTLALWMVLAMPSIIIILQTAIWLKNDKGFPPDVNTYLDFQKNVITMWAIFMQPLFIALVVGLIYNVEHVNRGWFRLYTLPIDRWVVPTAKLLVTLVLVGASAVILNVGIYWGSLISCYINPALDPSPDFPALEFFGRMIKVELASLGIIAIHNLIAFRWASMTVSIGVGIAATFMAIFANGWKYSYFHPWLMPLFSIHGTGDIVHNSLILGIVSGLIFILITMVYSHKKEPGLY